MKVTFCAYDFPQRVGGPYTWLPRLLPALQRYGIEPRVLAISSEPRDECLMLRALDDLGLPWQAIDLLAPTEHRIRWLLSALAAEPPDVFVPHLMVAGFYAGRWVRSAGIPTVGVLHADEPFYRAVIEEFVSGPEAQRLSGLVCVSQALADLARDRAGDGFAIRRIACGAPIPAATARFDPQGPLRIAYVGRLEDAQKRISDVTRAFCRATTDVPGTEAVIYGDGSDRATVEAILAASDAPVRLVGRVASDRLQAELLRCHAIALLSDYEGLPVALLEAMACGVVPVCLPIRSGIPELVVHGETGLLASDRGAGFVTAIRQLRADPARWQVLSQRARARVEIEFSIKTCAARWAEFLASLPRGRGSVRVPGRLRLPPVRPEFAREDWRVPPWPRRLRRNARFYAGRLRRQWLGPSQ